MLKLLSITTATILVFGSACAAGQTVERTQPRRSDLVYVGSPADMPTNADYAVAIEVGNLAKPTSLDEAARLVVDAMPGWMRAAIWQSHDDHACVVFVNDVDYFAIVVDWFVEEWRSRYPSKDVVEVIAPRAEDLDAVKAKLQETVCAMVKRGES